jgi:hypothetical protein
VPFLQLKIIYGQRQEGGLRYIPNAYILLFSDLGSNTILQGVPYFNKNRAEQNDSDYQV